MIKAAIAAALALFALPASAQEDETEAAITVNGVLNQKQRIDNFVRALAVAPPGGQLSRFEDAICPAVLGMPDARRKAVEQRLRQIARAVGLEVGAANCTPNVLVMVTRDKADFMKVISKKYPDFFGGMTPTQVNRIMQQKGSATAWQIERMLDADGRPIPLERDPSLDAPINNTIRSPSRITTSQRPALIAAAVVIEADALHGLSVTQLADYAAMRALGRADPARIAEDGPESILRIIDAPDGTALPVTLTRWDLAFLKGLYSSSKNAYASAQRIEIARVLARELEAAE